MADTDPGADQIASLAFAKNSQQPSAFTRLPLELRRKIYSYLLHTDHVRQPPDENMVPSYAFSTPILSVSKRIHEEARETLYHDNHFLLISTNSKSAKEVWLKRFAIPVVCRKRKLLRTFQSHALRVHVTLPLSCERRDAKVIEGFLLVAEDLRTFIRLLQTWNLAHGACLDTKLNIRLEKALSLKNQKHLLEPFRGLVALPGYVRIGGSVDHGYAKDLCQHIMPPVRWARASGWLCYDLALWLAKFGNAALRAKKYTLAETKYWDCLSLFQSARESHAGLEEVEDDDLALAIGDLISACSTNRALATLLYKDVDIEWKAATAMDFTSHYDFESSAFSTDAERGRLNLYRAISLALLSEAIDAGYFMSQADNLIAMDKDFNTHVANHISRAISSTDSRGTLLSARADIDNFITAQLSNEPFEVRAPTFSPSEFIADERYVLRKFGYQGDMLDHIKESTKADRKSMDEVFDALQAWSKACKCPPWVGRDSCAPFSS